MKTVLRSSVLPVDSIKPNPLNPRKRFDDDKLQELAESIRQVGVLQPLIVAEDEGHPGTYFLIAGERRLRAARIAGHDSVPVIYRHELFDSANTQVVAMLIENLQREDLDPIEEARAFAALTKEHGWTQTDLAAKIGVSQSHIANRVRLLNLPESAQEAILEGKLTVSAGKDLATLAKVPEARGCIDEAIADERDERGVIWMARQGAFDATAPLHSDGYIEPEFDTKDCQSCEQRVMLPGINVHDDGGGLRPYCMREECWNEKQTAAVEEEVERARQQALDTEGDNDGLLNLAKMANDSYEFLEKGRLDEDCVDCEHRAQGKYSWTQDGEHHEVCLKPACHEAKEKEIERERTQREKELREAHEEHKEQLIASFYPRGLLEDEDPDNADHQALVYITARMVRCPPYSAGETRAAIYERYGWEQPDGLDYYDEIKHLVQMLSTLPANVLLGAIFFAALIPTEHDSTVFEAVYGGGEDED